MEVVGTEELDVISSLDITVNNTENITAIDPTDTEVQVVKRAYTVVGDNVYVPSGSYDDAPDWVKNLVQNVVNFEVDARDTNLLANVDSILSLFENGYVPKNQYDNYVIQQQTAYDSLTTRVDSLDATVQTNETDVNAKIQNIENTYATTDSAAALVTTGIQASINDTVSGTSIGSKIASVQQTIADLDSTYSANYDVLTSSLADIDTKTDANATAVSGLTTRVSQTESGILANASDITNLSVELSSGTNSWAIADTTLTNTLNQTIADGITAAESNFEYNSNLTINGITKQSGFGIVNEFSSVNNAPATGESEFWIEADKLRFTDATTKNQPFYIANGETVFNGKVTFNNVDGGQTAIDTAVNGLATEDYVDTQVASVDVSGDIADNNETFAKAQGFTSYQNMVDEYVLAGQTVINGGYINTGLINANAITADRINTNGLVAESVSSSFMDTYQLNASNITSGTLSGDYIDATTLKVRQFDNYSSKIISHYNNYPVPLMRTASARDYSGTYPGSVINNTEGIMLNCTTTDVRQGAGYNIVVSGVYGDVRGGYVECSYDGSTWTRVGYEISASSGTHRTYTYIFNGTVTSALLPSNRLHLFWRINWIGGVLSTTYQSMYITIDNTR